jgi:hypothetical protein
MMSELVSGSIASQPVRKKKTDHNPLPPAPPGTHEGPHALGHPSSLQLQQDASDHKRVGPTRHAVVENPLGPGCAPRRQAERPRGEEIVPELRLLPSNPDDRINYEREPTLVRANTYYGQRGGRRHPSHPNYN